MRFSWPTAIWEDTHQRGREGTSIDIIKMAQYLSNKYRTITLLDTVYYCIDGIYHRDEGFIDSVIINCMNETDYDKAVIGLAKEIKAQIKSINWTSEYPFNTIPNIIPVNNGVVILEDDGPRLSRHDHEFLNTKKINADYNPDIGTEEITELLEQWLDGEQMQCLIQIPALAIIQSWGAVYKIAYLLEGKRDAGKSTYCSLVTNLFGHGQYSMADLSDLIRHRFAKAQLEGSYINIQDDLPGIPLTQIGKFKDLTGKTVHEVERKGKQPYTTILSALHLYTCNEPPLVEFVDDDAFWSRWNYLIFTGSFDRDPEVGEKMKDEKLLSGFLNLIIEEIIRILEDPKRVYRMDPDDVKQLWTLAVDYVSQYVNTCCIREPTAVISKDELYEHYVSWCMETNKTAVDKGKITRSLARMGVSTTKISLGGKRVWAYKGIKFKHRDIELPKEGWTPLEAERTAMRHYQDQAFANGEIEDIPDDNFDDMVKAQFEDLEKFKYGSD